MHWLCDPTIYWLISQAALGLDREALDLISGEAIVWAMEREVILAKRSSFDMQPNHLSSALLLPSTTAAAALAPSAPSLLTSSSSFSSQKAPQKTSSRIEREGPLAQRKRNNDGWFSSAKLRRLYNTS